MDWPKFSGDANIESCTHLWARGYYYYKNSHKPINQRTFSRLLMLRKPNFESNEMSTIWASLCLLQSLSWAAGWTSGCWWSHLDKNSMRCFLFILGSAFATIQNNFCIRNVPSQWNTQDWNKLNIRVFLIMIIWFIVVLIALPVIRNYRNDFWKLSSSARKLTWNNIYMS
jgi:hypothetical protein